MKTLVLANSNQIKQTPLTLETNAAIINYDGMYVCPGFIASTPPPFRWGRQNFHCFWIKGGGTLNVWDYRGGNQSLHFKFLWGRGIWGPFSKNQYTGLKKGSPWKKMLNIAVHNYEFIIFFNCESVVLQACILLIHLHSTRTITLHWIALIRIKLNLIELIWVVLNWPT